MVLLLYDEPCWRSTCWECGGFGRVWIFINKRGRKVRSHMKP